MITALFFHLSLCSELESPACTNMGINHTGRRWKQWDDLEEASGGHVILSRDHSWFCQSLTQQTETGL